MLIPAYNAARFLPRLLSSAAGQTEAFDDIWVYDDCSTDNTSEVAAAHGAKVVAGDVNRGCSVGKNRLAAVAETDWIHFHDADDALLPNFVALAHRWMERDDMDVVLFDYEYRDDGSGELLALNRFDKAALERDARHYALTHQINPFCGLYRRSSFLSAGGYDEDPSVLYHEDVAFHVRMAFDNLRFSSEGQVAIVNYLVPGSMSSNNVRRCAVARFNVLKRASNRESAGLYARVIADELWKTSGVLASVNAWTEARDAAELAASLSLPSKSAGRLWFRIGAALHPSWAVKAREHAIRVFKPHLRRSPS